MVSHLDIIFNFSKNRVNPFTSVGSYLTHQNWPLNWPDFAAWPTLPSWPAHSKHTVACMHRFSHILLRVSPEPAVWFMSEWRAVRIDHARKICGSTDHFQPFWNGYGREGVRPDIVIEMVSLYKHPIPEVGWHQQGHVDKKIPSCGLYRATCMWIV